MQCDSFCGFFLLARCHYLCAELEIRKHMNKYYQMLDKILRSGKSQTIRKGHIRYLLNERLVLTPADLLDIFESHGIARKKLSAELSLFIRGEREVEKYREAGITWWDYCGHTLVNSYPTYFAKLPPLVAQINAEKRNSKQPVSFPSAGSTFKRPPGHFAGQLIEEAGLKGVAVGGAQVSTLHSGFIINRGGATATDILQLITLVQNRVYDETGVMLEPEVRIIG